MSLSANPRPSEACCYDMAFHLDHEECEDHPNLYACPDVVIVRTSYGYALPIHDGGQSGIEIHHCPWCGARLGKP